MNDRLDRLERLHVLRQSGALTDAEFEAEKARALAESGRAKHGRSRGILMAASGLIVIAGIAATWRYLVAHRDVSAPPVIMTPAVTSRSMPPPTRLSPLPAKAALALAGTVAFSGQDSVHVHAVALLPVDDRYAVIGVGEGDGSHASAGTLAVQYVDRTAAGFEKTGPLVSEQTGSMGAIGEWNVRHDLGDRPIIALDGGGTWQGCTSGGVTLIELDKDGPRTLSTFIPTSLEDDSTSDHGPSYAGKIERAGSGLAVSYSGSVNATIALRRIGSKLVPDQALPDGC